MRPDDLAAFLDEPHIAVLATLRRDGRPYTVPVWFLHVDGAFWITGTYERVWCKQLFADPRASLCIEATSPVAGHVGADGTVIAHELPDFDIWPMSRQLVDKYVPAPARAPFSPNMQPGHPLFLELAPDVAGPIDMGVSRGNRPDRDSQRRRDGGRAP